MTSSRLRNVGRWTTGTTTPCSSHSWAICRSIGRVRVITTNGRPVRTKYGSHIPTW